ncbi:MAG: DNA polymerase III subunit gamma/tau [Lachnospiraceae bacterium]|nr:DNA polymerase III subunit gamma/tau [Lachnospiraceae bacterium]
MSYTALYRKYRPTTFTGVKGQEHIVTTLQNQIKANRIGHAYLFCGTRGTGKTSVAKIFAKAVNCEKPQEGNPCGVCGMCLAIAKNASLNVIEIDAASNNGVDNIREIREEVAYRPTEGKYKVYIIDEVHMLSTGAFNALLKTLEEPPAYVIFILATTESHKIPVTILSRCQQYDFRRIPIETLAKQMQDLISGENVVAEEKAIYYIAKAADGSMRDALSLLDQCIAFYLGQTLTHDNVLEVLGTVDSEVFSRLLRLVIKGDVAGTLEILEELIMNGRELTQMTLDFTWYLRNLILLKTSAKIEGGQVENTLDVTTESLQLLKEEAKLVEAETLLRYIRVLSELVNKLRFASQKRVLLEVAFIKLCVPEMESQADSLLERIRVLENKIEKVNETYHERSTSIPLASQVVAAVEEKPPPPMILPEAVPEDIKAVAQSFRSIVASLPSPMKQHLAGEKVKLTTGSKNCLRLIFLNEISYGYMIRGENKKALEEMIQEKIGKKVEIQVDMVDQGKSFEQNYVDLEKCFQNINFDITEVT